MMNSQYANDGLGFVAPRLSSGPSSGFSSLLNLQNQAEQLIENAHDNMRKRRVNTIQNARKAAKQMSQPPEVADEGSHTKHPKQTMAASAHGGQSGQQSKESSIKWILGLAVVGAGIYMFTAGQDQPKKKKQSKKRG